MRIKEVSERGNDSLSLWMTQWYFFSGKQRGTCLVPLTRDGKSFPLKLLSLTTSALN